MSKNFFIEVRNSAGLPVTNPQETRSEEGYLKNLTIEGTLEVKAGGEIKNEDSDYLLNETGLSFLAVSESLAAGPNKTRWVREDRESVIEMYGIREPNTLLPPDDNSETYLIIDFKEGDTRMLLLRSASLEIGNRLFVLSTQDSFSKDTGAVVVEGGIGVEKNVYVGKDLSIGGSFFINGKHELNTGVSTTYTVASGVSSVLVNDPGVIGATITLPSGELGVGRVIFVKDITGSASGGPIVIQRQGSDTIDGSASVSLTTAYQGVQLINTKPNVWSVVDIAVSSGGSGTVTSIATNNGITGGTITSTGTIGLTGQALALHNLATNGIIARTSSGNVAARTITAGTGISITNGDGVSGNPTITATNNGTVTSVGGTGTVSGVTLSGNVTTSGNLTLSGTLAVTAANFASQTANTFLAAPSGSAGVPTFRALVAADVPTLNQNTTGSALSLKANNTSGVLQVTGPTNGTTRVMTTPDVNFTVARTDAGQTFTGTQTFSSTISGSITGNAGTVTNGVYTTGDQTIGGLKTFSSQVTVGTGSVLAADTGIVFSYLATGGGGASSLKLVGPEVASVGGTQIRLPASSGTVALTSQLPTVNNGTLTLATSGIATGSASFTANQSGASTFTVNVPATNIAQGTRTTTSVPITSSTGTGATLDVATTSLAGVMSSADKTKLDGIAANANNYTHPNHTGDVTSAGDGATTIANNVVTNAKLANMAVNTIKGRATAGTGVPEDLTAAQVRTILNVANGATANVGTVTSVGGTGTVSGVTLSGNVTTSGNLTLSGTLAVTAANFASQTANTFLAAPSGSAGTPTFRTIVAADVPTLNQNTTGSAATLTTSRNIGGTAFNGSANIEVIQVKANNSSGLLQVTGPTNGTTRVMTTPDANFTVARTDAAQTFAGTQTFNSTISGSITGNAGTVTNGVYTTGDQTIGGLKTFSSQVTVGTGSVLAADTGIVFSYLATGGGGASSLKLVGPEVASVGGTQIRLPASSGTVALTSQLPSVGNGTLTLAVSGTGLSGSASFTANQSGNATFTVTSNATSANTASTIVARDASGNFTAGTITAALTGNASTATTLQTARTINGVSFNGSANITVTANTPNSVTFNNGGSGGASGSTFNGGSALTVSYNTVGAPSTTGANASGTWGISITGFAATAGSADQADRLKLNGTGRLNATVIGLGNTDRTMTVPDSNFTVAATNVSQTFGGTQTFSNTISGSVSGNAGTATTLATTRTLWGQNFNGSGNVTGALSSVTTLAMSGQLTNTVAVGTAPFVITSTTRVANLNVATAGTADTLTTARNIGGTSFNGSASIEVIQVKANNSSGLLQVSGPASSTTRVMTTPNANFTVARTDAAQTFTGTHTFGIVKGAHQAANGASGGTSEGNIFFDDPINGGTWYLNFRDGLFLNVQLL